MALTKEEVQKLMESEKAGKIPVGFEFGMEKIFQNTYTYLSEKGYLNESNVSGDVAQFIPKMLPLQRRVMPSLLAHEIASVQPISTPIKSAV